jgi:hypothetical protein
MRAFDRALEAGPIAVTIIGVSLTLLTIAELRGCRAPYNDIADASSVISLARSRKA